MATYEITAEMNLKKIVAESREIAQALNEFADNLEQIEEKYRACYRDNLLVKGSRLAFLGEYYRRQPL